uniref:Uncharacterized protein n=1 Tax=Rhizophora mucronata TaxID=61149 RepID=A0A2P2Q8A3_RHIMU
MPLQTDKPGRIRINVWLIVRILLIFFSFISFIYHLQRCPHVPFNKRLFKIRIWTRVKNSCEFARDPLLQPGQKLRIASFYQLGTNLLPLTFKAFYAFWVFTPQPLAGAETQEKQQEKQSECEKESD